MLIARALVSARDGARLAVIRAGRHPLLGALCHHAHFGLRDGVVAAARLDREIEGLFSRESGGGPVPGLSDYDLTIVPRATSIAGRLRFLERCWSRYRRLKPLVPMLAEIDILDPRDLVDHLTFGPGPLAAGKRLVPLLSRFGEQRERVARALGQQSRNVTGRDLLREAILRYLRHLVCRRLDLAASPSALRAASLRHVADKLETLVLRSQGLSPAVASAAPLTDLRAAEACFAQTLSLLTTACRSDAALHRAIAPHAVEPPNGTPRPRGVEACGLALGELSLVRQSPERVAVVCWNAAETHQRFNLALVVDDDLEPARVASCFDELARIWRRCAAETRWFSNAPLQPFFFAHPYPILVTRAVWRCWLALTPVEAAAVAGSADAVAGNLEVLDGVRPDGGILPRDLGMRYAALLSYRNNWRPFAPHQRALFYPIARELISGYAAALAGEPLRPWPTPRADPLPDLERGYAGVDGALAGLRQALVSCPVRATLATSQRGR
jgi:hypothetical protein